MCQHGDISLCCQGINLFWKTAVQNVVCVSVYFVADTKILYGYNFVAPFRLLKHVKRKLLKKVVVKNCEKITCLIN